MIIWGPRTSCRSSASDNIPGAPGIGAKTAAQLIQQFGSLDALLENPAAILQSGIRGAKRLAQIVEDNTAQLRLYRRITGIHCDVPMTVGLDDLQPGVINQAAVSDFCEEMQFKGRLKSRLLGADK